MERKGLPIAELNIDKKTAYQTGTLTVQKYLNEITRSFGEKDGDIKSKVEEIAIAVLLEMNLKVDDYCFYSNKVGVKLADLAVQLSDEGNRETSAQYFRAAAESYEFAFQEEDAYEPNRAIYADNFSATIKSHIKTIPAVSSESQNWLNERKVSFYEAQRCIIHFKNLCVYEAALRTLQREGKQPDWQDQKILDRASLLQTAESKAEDVAKFMSMLPSD